MPMTTYYDEVLELNYWHDRPAEAYSNSKGWWVLCTGFATSRLKVDYAALPARLRMQVTSKPLNAASIRLRLLVTARDIRWTDQLTGVPSSEIYSGLVGFAFAQRLFAPDRVHTVWLTLTP